MTTKMKTVCVGRYLVDVPGGGEFRLSGGRISGFAIDVVEESEVDFRNRVQAREAEINARGGDRDEDGTGGMVEAHDLQIPGLIGRSLIYGRSRGYMMEGDRRVDMESVSIETHAHMSNLSFSLTASSKQEADIREAEALLSRLRARGEDDIPTVPGFCVWRGVFVDPLPPHTSEQIVFHLGFSAHPDMGMALSSIAGGHPDEGLLARVAHTDAESTVDEMLRVTKLRSGKRNINGIDGEEVLERVRELNFTTGYSFMWEAGGDPDDPLQPNLQLDMESGTNPRPAGRPVESSLHEDAVLALWDRISSSIRLRPATLSNSDRRKHT